MVTLQGLHAEDSSVKSAGSGLQRERYASGLSANGGDLPFSQERICPELLRIEPLEDVYQM